MNNYGLLFMNGLFFFSFIFFPVILLLIIATYLSSEIVNSVNIREFFIILQAMNYVGDITIYINFVSYKYFIFHILENFVFS